MPMEQSQSPIQPSGCNLDHQRQSLRLRRKNRYSRNPIAHSPRYRAYRARQSRGSNKEDAKWPEILEAAFLDALIDLPAMGRSKFYYKGKPHGRNELIKEYIWIAYLQSLAPGQRPDPSMARDRKQVSSHIQVLKVFLKGHPAFDRLFPSNKNSRDEIAGSFQNDPCLRALLQGRLPNKRYEHFSDLVEILPQHQQISVKPVNFWLLVTSAKIREDSEDFYEKATVTHRYSRLSSQTCHLDLNSIPNWGQRFPYLEPFNNNGELDCDIIHMDVSLNLTDTHAEDGADLVTRSEISVTGLDEMCQWQTVTSLIKPQELCRHKVEIPLEASVAPTKILSTNAGETRLKVRFPAEEWTYIFTCLTELQLNYEGSQNGQIFSSVSPGPPVQELLQQISMYQEIQSCSGIGKPFIRKAIILWTFSAAVTGEGHETTWQYVNVTSSPSSISPSPNSSRRLSTTTDENFSEWITGSPLLQAQHDDVWNPCIHGLITSPGTAELQPTFAAGCHGYYDQQFDAPLPDNFSFGSITTIDSESTLVDDNISPNFDAYLSNPVNVRMLSVDHTPSDWDMTYTELLNPGPPWTKYAALPPNASHFEDETEIINQSWKMEMDPRLNYWTELKDGNGDWIETGAAKQNPICIEQSDNKLLPWLDPVSNETKNIYVDVDNIQLPNLSPGPADTRDPAWIGTDSSFDFNQLVERLKA